MDSILEALHLNFKVMFTQLVGFILLFWLLKKFLFGPVGDMIRKRTEEIKGEYENNEKGRKEVEDLKNEYQKKILDLKEEGKKIIAEGKANAEKEREEIIARANVEAEEIIKAAFEKIKDEKEKVSVQLKSKLADISIEAASMVLSKSISKEDHRELFNNYLAKIDTLCNN